MRHNVRGRRTTTPGRAPRRTSCGPEQSAGHCRNPLGHAARLPLIMPRNAVMFDVVEAGRSCRAGRAPPRSRCQMPLPLIPHGSLESPAKHDVDRAGEAVRRPCGRCLRLGPAGVACPGARAHRPRCPPSCPGTAREGWWTSVGAGPAANHRTCSAAERLAPNATAKADGPSASLAKPALWPSDRGPQTFRTKHKSTCTCLALSKQTVYTCRHKGLTPCR